MASREKCAAILEGSFLSAKDAEKMLEKITDPSEIAANRKELKYQIQTMVEEGMDKEIMRVNDKHIAKRDAMLDIEGAKTETDVLKARGKRIYGRNSMDTTRRSLKADLFRTVNEYEFMFQVDEKFGIRNIEQGSAEEAKLFELIYNIEDQLDVDTLTSARAEKLVEGSDDPLLKTAYAIVAHNEFARRFMINHGIPIRFHKNYVTRRRYDWAILEEQGPDGWADFMFDRLDLDKTFNGRTEEKFVKKELKKIYEDFRKSNRAKANMFSMEDRKIKTSDQHARKFVFKDAKAEYEAFNELSIGGLREQIEENVWGMATYAVKVDRLGYDHAKVGKEYADIVEDEVPQETRPIQKIGNVYRKQRVQQAIADFTGENSYVASGLSTFGTTFKTTVSVGKLGNTLNVAILDPLDTARQNFYVNGEAFGGFIKYKKNMFGIISKLDKQQRAMLADHLGVITNYLSTESAMRVAKGDLATNRASKIGQAVEKHGARAMELFTFLPQQTALSKVSSALTGAQVFSDMVAKVTKGWDTLNKFELDTLKEYGLTEQDMKVIGMSDQIKTWGENTIYSSKSIRDSFLLKDLDATAKQLGVEPDKIGEYVVELTRKYDNYLNDFFSRGTPTPELSAKTALLKGGKNELGNVTASLLTQFMDTPVMQLQSTVEVYDKLKRIHGAGMTDPNFKEVSKLVGNIGYDALRSAVPHALAGSAMYIGFNVMWSALLGKEDVIDKYQKADSGGKNAVMLDILGRTSVLPFAFEALNNGTSEYYNGNVADTFVSPFASMSGDLLNVANPNSSNSVQDFAKKQIPNAWFVQMFNNHLLE